MKIIVGLGNPDLKYKNTRHNLGFMVLEKIAEQNDLTFKIDASLEAKIADDGNVKLVLPQTYMNDSGRSVQKVKNYWKVDEGDILVIHDDVDLPLGKMRISEGGSSAGHKGIQSIIENIGENFWRVRIGIGKNEVIPTEKWVLENFSEDESKIITQAIDKIVALVLESMGNNLKEETINI